MATRFGKFQTLAQRLIKKNGRSVTFRSKSTTPSDPLEPWLGFGADTDTTGVPAVFVDYKSNEIDGSIVQTGDKVCLIAALDLGATIRPKTKDIIVDGTTNWNVVNVETVQPGNVAETILHKLQVRS